MQALEDLGMNPVARFYVDRDEFHVDFVGDEIAEQDCCIYAFVIGDEIVRIGSCKSTLRVRLKATKRHFHDSIFRGKYTPTSKEDGEFMREQMKSHGHGIVWGRQGTMVTTPVGTFPAYLDEESILLGRYRPPLNHSFHR